MASASMAYAPCAPTIVATRVMPLTRIRAVAPDQLTLPYLGRPGVGVNPTFEPLTQVQYDSIFNRGMSDLYRKEPELNRGALAPVSVVAYLPRWGGRRDEDDVGPILAEAAKHWPRAHFFSLPLERGTPTGERIFATLRAHGFAKARMPILDVFCGSERVYTLALPQGEGGGDGAACPLLTERGRIGLLQQAIQAARQRVNASRRWRERRSVLLDLCEVRRDLRRMRRFKAGGLVSRTWRLVKETNGVYRDPQRTVYSPERLRLERKRHLLGLLQHARLVGELEARAARLERRRRHLAHLVLARQRCSEHGCVLLDGSEEPMVARPRHDAVGEATTRL